MELLNLKKIDELVNERRFEINNLNSKNSKTSDPHRLLLNIVEKIYFKRSNKYVALSNLSIFYTWKIRKNSYKNTTFKISALAWNEEFELTDGSYFVSHIQRFFLIYLKKI